MRIRRRSLRKGLVVVGCLVGEITWPAAALGGVAIAIGGALHFWAKGCLEQNRRLTTAGPYRFTRNPFYLANATIDLGICCVIGSVVVAAVYAALFALSYRDTIEREEARLSELFGDAYARYLEAVPRFLPNGRVLPESDAEGRFSLDNAGLAQGAEYARLLGIALAPYAIAAAEVVRRERLDLISPGHDEAALAFVLGLPALWIVKLALAETFRRPQTALVPWLDSARARAGLAVGLLAAALFGADWTSVAAGLGAVLLALDLFGDRRAGQLAGRTRTGRPAWRYAGPVLGGTILIAVCIGLLRI